MTEYGTIRIPKPAYDHHNEQRQERGLTWEQYINEVDLSNDVSQAVSNDAVTPAEAREIAREQITEHVVAEAQR